MCTTLDTKLRKKHYICIVIIKKELNYVGN